jgi:exopolyphosphatase/guanosine-5'-triphosphate,3'-diphosphate pyrophosphatase
MTRIVAAADIGSNTAHLLVAQTDGDIVMRIDNFNEWIPLGEVVSNLGHIPKEQAQALVLAVREFRRLATAKQAETLYVFATEGMRMAQNHEAILAKILAETGVTVDIISPYREVELSLGGVLLDSQNLGIDLMFEVGGGSLQLARVANNRLMETESLPLGTGRVIAESGLRNPCPPHALAAAIRYINHVLDGSELPTGAKTAVASGGVGRGLWRALNPDGEKSLGYEAIDYMAWAAARLPIERLVSRFNVKQRRAGTLLPGALIYRALLEKFNLREIAISEFGIREGAVRELVTTLPKRTKATAGGAK